ncbi:MAG: methionine adenosyltransferase [Cytophagales bacterium]|nr:methionine adenosyltransferase [Cytophagales bacterium]
MSYLFTAESVSEGHPDKIADQISDAILDAMLEQDPTSKVACETFVTTGQVIVGGEVTTKAYVEISDIVRNTIRKIGYTKDVYKFDAESCGILVSLHSQSPDITQGISKLTDEELGAGDQGVMFGYAINETPEYIPMALAFAHRLVKELARVRKEEPELMPYLRPDAKAQITIEYSDDHRPLRVHTIVLSTQHDEFVKPIDNKEASKKAAETAMTAKIKKDVIEHIIKKVIPKKLLNDTIYHINPTGKFVLGGPHADAGLTGRKIVVDTYGGKCAHGGGAFSGKDASKVDRSAAYAARHIAKNLVAAGVADEVLIQVSYAIGISEPTSIMVNTWGTAHVNLSDNQITQKVKALFDMRPKAIIERLGLLNPIFFETAAYGHMGRTPFKRVIETKTTTLREQNGLKEEIRRTEEKEVTFFTWEKLDQVDRMKQVFGL